MSGPTFVRLCLAPLGVTVAVFFLLPMVRLVIAGAGGPEGLSAYAAILTEPRYRATLINTVLLAAATTGVTLVIATVAALFLQRNQFPGRAVLIAMLTFPLAFPGVVVGFMIILLAGRQGLIGDITQRITGDKLVFAYSIGGLFLGYLYFSIPRVILTARQIQMMPLAELLVIEARARADGICRNPTRRPWGNCEATTTRKIAIAGKKARHFACVRLSANDFASETRGPSSRFSRTWKRSISPTPRSFWARVSLWQAFSPA